MWLILAGIQLAFYQNFQKWQILIEEDMILSIVTDVKYVTKVFLSFKLSSVNNFDKNPIREQNKSASLRMSDKSEKKPQKYWNSFVHFILNCKLEPAIILQHVRMDQ